MDVAEGDYLTYAVTRRAYLPFGQDRGTPPTNWPGDDGYIGGTPDTSTGPENLGAREYDPTTGRFISADPVLETTSPTQLGGYEYSGNDPVTYSDPTGQMLVDPQFGSFGNAHVLQDWMHDEGYTDSHGKSTQKYQNYLSDYNRDWDAYYYQTTHPQPKPKKKSSGTSWTSYLKKAASVAYDYSGAKDVVGCATNPTLGGCIKAGTLVLGFVATGGEDELEVAALEAAEDDGASVAEKAATACLKKPHSFTGSTPVLKSDGHSEPIKNIKVGDKVEATDPQTGVTAAHTVERVIKTTTDRDFTNLTIRTTKPGKNHTRPTSASLTTTWHHPFWNATTNQWTDASRLTPGTHLREPDGTYATVTKIRNYHSTAVTYDLTIAGLHTYYVLAGATPVLVHNCAAGGRPKGLRPDPNAEGPHVTFRRDASTGKVNHYAEWAEQSNPRNPAPWELVKRVDMQGVPHYDKVTGEVIPTPHVNLPDGTARATEPWEETWR
ncbi:RHS repeat-associated core domain-containing protein [Streptomyces sp. NPDC048106]|uniref:RHS repeat-associated core domain-containing protein n=1 Tax=Streptomyces sp. NPDC048106 TaxID=3155750 RepID=UPI00345666CA